jgi:hypothetical protein
MGEEPTCHEEDMTKKSRALAHRPCLETLEARLLLTFLPPVNYSTGSFPSSVAMADFNGDGAPDLAVANFSFGNGNTVGIRLNNGDGTFKNVVNVFAGEGVYWVTTGDFNGDNRVDLAVANLTGRVHVLVGNGNGTFQPAKSFATGPFAAHLVAADLNGDGRQDLTVASPDSHSINVLLGNGDGTFQPYKRFRAGIRPYGVAAADFNADGAMDVVVANLRSLNSTVHVLLGKGDGTFNRPILYHAAGRETRHVEVADMNADGSLDIVAANSASGSVSILLGNGNGTFQSAVYYKTAGAPMHIAIADFDANGTIDVAAVDYTYPVGHVSILPGLGDGTLGDFEKYQVGNSPFAVAAGDLNADQLPDLAVANGYSSNMSVLINTADRTAPLPSPPAFTPPAARPLLNSDQELSKDAYPPLPVPRP